MIATGSVQAYEEVEEYKAHVKIIDDFSLLEKSPGKVLILGGSALAFEYAGILASLGFSTTMLVQNIALKGLDRDMVLKVTAHLENHGVRIVKKMILADLCKQTNGKIKTIFQSIREGEAIEEEFDTVFVANNRTGVTESLKLVNAGLKPGMGGKLRVNDMDQTNVPHIFALGDVALNRPESAAATARAGQLLARRLFNGSTEKMEYNMFPYTLLTPIEYGCDGMTEEEAVKKYGKDNVDVFHTSFKPLEWELVESREDAVCYTKLIVTKPDDLIRGLHYFGPNAVEAAQGFSVALACGATKHAWDSTLAIHPTCAEVMVGMKNTRAAVPNSRKTGC